ncbi:hypothetical protein V8G54_036075 [Vigna mungo]|uniref:Retrotransposon gag domain-containing protein n=1 Tax=Vigna mungo TaxID=3915 RepID=A0AAQ3MGL6_VIGMU
MHANLPGRTDGRRISPMNILTGRCEGKGRPKTPPHINTRLSSVLCHHSHTFRENFPEGHPSLNYSRLSTLNHGVLMEPSHSGVCSSRPCAPSTRSLLGAAPCLCLLHRRSLPALSVPRRHTIECTEGQKLVFATYMLAGEVEYLWRGMQRGTNTRGEAATWEDFRARFLKRYFPASAKQ